MEIILDSPNTDFSLHFNISCDIKVIYVIVRPVLKGCNSIIERVEAG
jgi:hypothetical protein